MWVLAKATRANKPRRLFQSKFPVHPIRFRTLDAIALCRAIANGVGGYSVSRIGAGTVPKKIPSLAERRKPSGVKEPESSRPTATINSGNLFRDCSLVLIGDARYLIVHRAVIYKTSCELGTSFSQSDAYFERRERWLRTPLGRRSVRASS